MVAGSLNRLYHVCCYGGAFYALGEVKQDYDVLVSLTG